MREACSFWGVLREMLVWHPAAEGRPCAALVRRPRRRGLQVEEVVRRPGQEPFVFVPLRGREQLLRLLLGSGPPCPVALVESLHPGLEALLDPGVLGPLLRREQLVDGLPPLGV